MDLSHLEEGKAEAAFKLEGLPGKKEKSVKFAHTFRLARLSEYVCPMKCTDPLPDPGDCPKCGMALKKKPYIYACPMHPSVTSRSADDTCWICHMKLEKKMDDGGSSAKKGHRGHH